MAGYSGDGSYQKLIRNIYGANKVNSGINNKNYGEYGNMGIRIDLIILQLLSFQESGFFKSSSNSRTTHGYYWGKSLYNLDIIFSLILYESGLLLRDNYSGNKSYGLSVRWGAK